MSANPFTTARPAWIALHQLPDTVERSLAFPAAKAAEILRPQIESNAIRNVVVDWDASRAARFGARHWVAQGHPADPYPYCVYKQGWEHADWEHGTLLGCEIRVRWVDVQAALPTQLASSGDPGSKPDDKADAARLWMRAYAMGQNHAGGKPKRDETLKLCEEETGAKYLQALHAWNALPSDFKRPPRKARDKA